MGYAAALAAAANLGYGLYQGGKQRDAASGYAGALGDIDTQLYGAMAPEQARQYDTAYNNLVADPQAVAAQRAALDRIMQIGTSGGLTLEDKAALANAQAITDQSTRARNEAILQNARERGGLHSGQALGAQLISEQEGANQNRMAGLNSGAMAQRRALDALHSGASMASGMRAQGIDEQSRVAQARDAINAFNAQQRQQYFNNRMDLNSARLGLRTGQAFANKQAADIGIKNNAALAADATQAGLSLADYYSKQDDNTGMGAKPYKESDYTNPNSSPLRQQY